MTSRMWSRWALPAAALLACLPSRAADRGAIASATTVSGTITGPSVTDAWTFDAAAGDAVIVTAVTTSGSLNTAIALYGPDGTLVTYAPNGGDSLWTKLTQAGVHTIVIDDATLTATGDYNVGLQKIPGATSSASDPDGGPIASGETRSGTIRARGELDAWTFEAAAGDAVIVTAVTTSGSLNTAIALYGPDGTLVTYAPNGGDSFWTKLTQAGVHTIEINDATLTATGDYNVGLQKIPGATSSPSDPDGGLISSGETRSAAIRAPGEIDAFIFYASGSEGVLVTAVATGGTLNTSVALYGPDGALITYTPNGGDSLGATLSRPGIHTVIVSDATLLQTGSYSLSLTRIPATAVPGLYSPAPSSTSVQCEARGTLSWQAVAGATGYDVWFGTDVVEPLVQLGPSPSAPSIPMPAVAAGLTYYWRVVAHIGSGVVEGPTWWFTTAAFGTLAIDGGAATTASRSVTLSLGCTPGAGAACAEMRLSDDGSTWTAWEPYAPTRAWTLPAGAGTKTVWAELRDSAGLVSCPIGDSIALLTGDPCSGVVCTAQDQCHDAGTCNSETGTCSNPAKADGTACSDGSACTRTDTCQAGVCTGGNPVVCTAQDQCHDAGACNPATGACSNPAKANGTVCSDGDACTQADTCQAGTCTGGNPVVCTAQDACHDAGACNPATGACSNPAKADGTACSDGSACTRTDTCQAGVCTGGNPVVCTAQDQCHDAGACNPATGACSSPAKPDGTSCPGGTCQAGTCNASGGGGGGGKGCGCGGGEGGSWALAALLAGILPRRRRAP